MDRDPLQEEVRSTRRIMKTLAITTSLVCAVASLALVPAFLELRVCSMRLDVYLVLFLSLLAVYVSVPVYLFFIRQPLFLDPPPEWMRIGAMVHVQIGTLALSVFPEMWMVIKLKSYCRSKVRTGILVLIYIEYGLTALVSVLYLGFVSFRGIFFLKVFRSNKRAFNRKKAKTAQILANLGKSHGWKLITKYHRECSLTFENWSDWKQPTFLQEEKLLAYYLTWVFREEPADHKKLAAAICHMCDASFRVGQLITAIPWLDNEVIHDPAVQLPVKHFHTKCWLFYSTNKFYWPTIFEPWENVYRGKLLVVHERFPEMKGDKSKLPRFLIEDQDHSSPH